MLQSVSWLPRAHGAIRLGLRHRGDMTAIGVLHQSGVLRARFPHASGGGPMEAVLINTAGGLTGGDDVSVGVTLEAGCAATVTSAAAEKIYRARDGEDTRVRVRLEAGPGAHLAWLPQPTILFDRAHLDRRTEVVLAEDARLLAVEALIFGRAAMGEDVRAGAVHDAWRVRRGGELVLADAFRVSGVVAATLDHAAVLDGARAAATLLYAADDAAAQIEAVRGLIESGAARGGASLVNGLLVARLLAPDGRPLQTDITRIATHLLRRPLPRVWQC